MTRAAGRRQGKGLPLLRPGYGMPALYRLKVPGVEAMQWLPGDLIQAGGMAGWLMVNAADFHHPGGMGDETTLAIQTAAGEQTAKPGDWVIRTFPGGFFVIPQAIFELVCVPGEPT